VRRGLKVELARLRLGLKRHQARPVKRHPLSLAGQPLDSWLLSRSRLYVRSRRLFLERGGILLPALQSTPRSLSSAALLWNRIEYTPSEAELFWAALDPEERKNPEHLQRLRTFTSSLFHEQNHRLLWGLLPPAPREETGLRRYLNLAESLVIAADMALGDELGPKEAETPYLAGAIYDPGTRIKKEASGRRIYRNYLQAATHATYLMLEGYEPDDLPVALQALFPNLGGLATRVARRAGELDTLFIGSTNQRWQKKHRKTVIQALSGPQPLELPSHPMDNRQAYLIGENWFHLLGL
jgi:hypothetical protein